MTEIANEKYAQFRQEVRAFLDEKLTPELRAASRRQAGIFADADLARTWQRMLFERGWAAPNWPTEHGGPGWDALQRFIFQEELEKADAPRVPVFGLQLCGPVLMRYGTDEQKRKFLPRMLSGEDYWCQGYSEPEAGSDLANLKTRADRDGDHYVINGAKTWTSYAHEANWMFLLARTCQDVKPQGGISFLLLPMDTPGITIQPIVSLAGVHEQNMVFFDNVRIPVSNRVGEENEGWTVAKYLLDWERGGAAAANRLRRSLQAAKAFSKESDDFGSSFWADNPDFRRRVSLLEIEILGLEFAERQVAEKLAANQPIGATSSLLKLKASTLLQRVAEVGVDAIGMFGAVDQQEALGWPANAAPIGPDYAATPMNKYLNSRAATIYGGTYEVQHNILARVIGL